MLRLSIGHRIDLGHTLARQVRHPGAAWSPVQSTIMVIVASALLWTALVLQWLFEF